MTIDLKTSGLSELILFGANTGNRSQPPDHKRVLLPGDSAVRVSGRLMRLPLGETRWAGPCDLTYELVSQHAHGSDRWVRFCVERCCWDCFEGRPTHPVGDQDSACQHRADDQGRCTYSPETR